MPVERIAPIEDEYLFTRSVTRILEKADHEVVGCDDAGAALETCSFDDVDLILTDLAMPVSRAKPIRGVRDLGIDTPIAVMSAAVPPTRTSACWELKPRSRNRSMSTSSSTWLKHFPRTGD